MSTYARLCCALGRLAGWLSRAAGRGRGGTLPGRVVLALWPAALVELSRQREVLLVSGTNGKSTTTRLLAAAVSSREPVVSNTDGANMLAGLLGPLLTDRSGATAVLEVDEVVLPAAIEATDPAVVVLLNLSRDQLDRVGEVSSHVTRWAAALRTAPRTRVVANGDDPLVVAAVRAARPDSDSVVWVAAGSPWRADSTLCPGCGTPWQLTDQPWSCSHCGLSAPTPSWQLRGVGELVAPDGRHHELGLGLPGRASAANATMALAAAHALGVELADAWAPVRSVRDVDGRYLRLRQGGRSVQLLLAKNPAGWLEVLSEITQGQDALLLGINAQSADGTDPSWLWDVPFEQLHGRRVVVFGDRALELSVRLHYAEVGHDVERDLGRALALLDGVDVRLAANYTAFVTARAALQAAA